MMRYNPQNCYFLFEIINCWYERLFRKYSIVCMIYTNFKSKCGSPSFKGWFTDKVSSWIVLLMRCNFLKSLKLSTITWEAQMRALVSLPMNCGTNPGWYDRSWCSDTSYPGLFSVSFCMDPYVFPFVIYWRILDVTNMHGVQRGTSSFSSRNFDGRTPSFAILNMDLGCKWDKLSCRYLNSFCKGYRTYGSMILSIWYCVRFLDSLI